MCRPPFWVWPLREPFLASLHLCVFAFMNLTKSIHDSIHRSPISRANSWTRASRKDQRKVAKTQSDRSSSEVANLERIGIA